MLLPVHSVTKGHQIWGDLFSTNCKWFLVRRGPPPSLVLYTVPVHVVYITDSRIFSSNITQVCWLPRHNFVISKFLASSTDMYNTHKQTPRRLGEKPEGWLWDREDSCYVKSQSNSMFAYWRDTEQHITHTYQLFLTCYPGGTVCYRNHELYLDLCITWICVLSGFCVLLCSLKL